MQYLLDLAFVQAVPKTVAAMAELAQAQQVAHQQLVLQAQNEALRRASAPKQRKPRAAKDTNSAARCVTGRKCAHEGCEKYAVSPTLKCKAHGGGARCIVSGCQKSARDASQKCIKHGGGRRCKEEGCNKSAQGATWKCVAHGGGRRCSEGDCQKGAIPPTGKCFAHGGGRRCQFDGCNKGARGGTAFCITHGGKKSIPKAKNVVGVPVGPAVGVESSSVKPQSTASSNSLNKQLLSGVSAFMVRPTNYFACHIPRPSVRQYTCARYVICIHFAGWRIIWYEFPFSC